MPLSPKDVQDIRFDKAPLGKRGYDEDQVDEFLDRVEAALRAGDGLSPQQVREVEFGPGPIVRRGYDEKQVDEFLAVVVKHLQNGDIVGEPVTEPIPAQQPPAQQTAEPPPVPPVVRQPEPDPNSVPLPPAPPGMRGYRERDVLRMAECVRASLRTASGPTADDIARMRLARVEDGEAGYDPFLVEALREAWVAELRRIGR